MEALFRPFVFGADERAVLDRDGHFALPGILTDAACAQLTKQTRWRVFRRCHAITRNISPRALPLNSTPTWRA